VFTLCIYAIIYLGGNHTVTSIEKLRFADWGSFFIFLGVACYSIEGIGLIFPLRKDYMQHNTHKEFKLAYFLSYVFTLVIYLLFGVLNYLKFYKHTQNIIFFNYKIETGFVFILQIFYSIVS
jgi:amino acid permease